MAKDDKIPADDLIAIPDDEIQLGFDKDGLPKVEAGTKVATGKPIEDEAPDPAVKALERERDEAKAEAARLSRERDTERAARQAAEQDATRKGVDLDKRTTEAVGAHRAAVRERFDRVAREHDAVLSGITQANNMLAQAQRDLETAVTNGEGARVAELTTHVGRITGQLDRLEAAKPNVESYLNEAKNTYEETERYVAEAGRQKKDAPAPVAEQKGPKDFDDLVTNYADQWIDQSPRATQSWLREHKGVVMKDATKFEQLTTFAKLYALKNGESSLNSKTFVKALDDEFFPQQREPEDDENVEMVDDTQEAPPEPKAKPKKIAAAPVSRGHNVFGSQNLTGDKIYLEPSLKAALIQMKLDPNKWALQAREDIKNGKLPKEYLDPGYDRGI